MKAPVKAIVVILIIGALTALAIAGPQWTTALIGMLSKPREAAAEEPAVDVVAATVERGAISEVRSFGGNVLPLLQVDLMPQIQGKLVSLALKRGDETLAVSENTEVKEGEVLATLDFEGLKADWNEAESDFNRAVRTEAWAKSELDRSEIVGGLKADWDKAESDYERTVKTEAFTKGEMDRIVGLFKQEGATEQARDKAVYDHDVAVKDVEQKGTVRDQAKWRYEQAQNRVVYDHDVAVEDVKQKRAVADQAKWRYDQSFIKAPFDGVVSKVYVDPGATVGSGMPVLRLVHLAELKVIANVPNRYIGAEGIREQVTDVSVQMEGSQGAATAKVNKIYTENEKATRTNPVEIIITNEKVLNPDTKREGYKIRGNMYATVNFTVRRIENAVRISADAVVKIEDDDYVFVVENGVARKKKVTVGIWQDAFVEITDGLEGGETLVIGGQMKLTDGTKVNVVRMVPGGQESAPPLR